MIDLAPQPAVNDAARTLGHAPATACAATNDAEAQQSTDHGAKPFVKWAGGKRRLLAQMAPFFPTLQSGARYFEPFLGGGAVYFHLQPAQAVLSDLNRELITAYRVIRDSLAELMADLDGHGEDAAHYYATRARSVEELSPVEQASRFIYLNKWCYNGLYRVNSDGIFNVPRGRYSTPRQLYSAANLRAISRLLAGADLRVAPYQEALSSAQAGDFAYLDPPYAPLSSTAHFTSYTRHDFSQADQRALASALHDLDQRGVRFLLNNHNTPELRQLYEPFHVRVIKARRSINSRIDRRAGVEELVVTNYDPERPLG
ncbi:MAG TPA: DNA adenine methylase [Chloroflexota bacterium]|nr:DNA adenine methylase [Chloroflexota bacterium]